MKKLSLGMAAGASSLALAVPLLAQLSFAASGDTASGTADATRPVRPAPSIACVQALAAKDAAFLATIDAHIAAEKAATQAHRDALLAAAAITDDTQRQAAVQKAHEDFRTAMMASINAEDRKAEMEALKTACGDSFGSKHGLGPGMKGKRGMHPPKGEWLTTPPVLDPAATSAPASSQTSPQ